VSSLHDHARTSHHASVSPQVYAIGIYVEGAAAVKEFGVRARGGFFEDAEADQYCDAILDAACNKLVVIQLLRDLDGHTFADAINEKLAPRLTFTGETAVLREFSAFFAGQELKSGSQVLFLWLTKESCVEIAILPKSIESYKQVRLP
jgi:hypothetical protein